MNNLRLISSLKIFKIEIIIGKQNTFIKDFKKNIHTN